MTWVSLGLALIEASILRPAVLVFAVLVFLRVFRIQHRTHPASQHAIWTAMLAGMLLIPVASVWIPHWNIPILPVRTSADRREPPVSSEFYSSPAVPVANLAEQTTTRERSSLGMPVAAERKPIGLGQLVVGLYLTGLFAMIVYRVMGWIMLRRVLSRSFPESRGLLRESSDVMVPVTAGLFRPVVLLPAGWREWDSNMRRVVLVHEFEHIRRRDTVVLAFGRLVTSLLWFHPLAWWMVRKISELSEMVCDMAAAKAAETPAAYAQILLDFSARIHRTGHRVTLPGLAIAGSSDISRRVERLLELPDAPLRRLNRPAAILGLIGVPILCLAATLGVTGMPQQQQIVATFPIPSAPSPLPVAAIEQNAAAIQAPAVATGMGVIAGRLFLADGSPAPNTEVFAMSGLVERNGARIWDLVRSIRTDSDGRYQMEVPKGDYTVASMIGGNTYYPGVTDANRIKTIAVPSGQTVAEVNFRLDKSAGVRVRGRLVPAPGATYASIMVGLGTIPLATSDGARFIPDLFSYRAHFADIGLFPVRPDGSFEFPVVPQGKYAVRVFTAATAEPQTLFIPGQRNITILNPYRKFGLPDGYSISVGQTDVSGVEVPVPLLVAAHAVMENGDNVPTFIANRLNFKADGPEGYVAGVLPTGNTVYAFPGVLPPAGATVFALPAGQHRISFDLPFGYYMKTFSYGTTDLLRAPLSISGPATSEIIGTITTTAPANAAKFVTVRGRIAGLASPDLYIHGPLLAFLVAPGSRTYGYAPLRDDGTFEFRSVPPGTYSGYVTVSGGIQSPTLSGKTVVVADVDLAAVELPIVPYVIHDKR